MKRTLFFICTLLCVNVLLAQEIVIDDIKYEVTGLNEVAVKKYQGSATEVNIPSNINYGGGGLQCYFYCSLCVQWLP